MLGTCEMQCWLRLVISFPHATTPQILCILHLPNHQTHLLPPSKTKSYKHHWRVYHIDRPQVRK
jgi:hypothetical protein